MRQALSVWLGQFLLELANLSIEEGDTHALKKQYDIGEVELGEV